METVEIERLAPGGDGAAAGIFVPFALPGEKLRGAVVDGRMEAAEILSPSPDRVTPPCPLFTRCGGCALQHAADGFVAAWKRDVIAEALARAGVAAGDILATQTSPPASRRRASFAIRRTKKTVVIGFHARASEEVVSVADCAVLRPALIAARAPLAALAPLAASRKSPARALVTESEAGLDIALDAAKPPTTEAMIRAADIAETADLARLTWNGEPVAERRPPIQRFGEARVAPPPGGFLQATAAGEAALVAAAQRAVGPASRGIDLFSGCGTFTLPLAASAELHAVESDAAALAALDAGWRGMAGGKRVTTETRDLFRRPIAGAELKPYEAAIIDPPRAGAEAQSRALAEAGPPRIAAISCNPATFARDARILAEGGYRLDWVLPVDQFRWSPHVELAAAFSR